MKRIIVFAMVVLISGIAFGETENEKILEVLEEINEKLERVVPDDDWDGWDDEDEDGDNGKGFGGGPFMAFRWLIDMQDLNDYLKDIGQFGGDKLFSPILYPFVDGGGGTWRVSLSERLQFGISYFGYGQNTWGYLNHTEDSQKSDDTIDENGDGYDDYVSYVEWGFGGANFIMEYKLPISPKSVYLELGGTFGMGSEGLTVDRSPRQVSSVIDDLMAVQILTGRSDWSRMYFSVGGFTGLQFSFPKTKGVVSFALEAGFDYHIPMEAGGKWTPGVGVHRKEKSPPVDFNSMNVWFHLGPQFNY